MYQLDDSLQEIADELEVVSPEDDDADTYDDVLADCLQTMWGSSQIKNITLRVNELKLTNVNVNLDALA